MMHNSHLFRSISVAAAALFLVSCDAPEPTAALAPGDALRSTTSGAILLECPTDVTKSVTGTIDLLGGTLELDGHQVVFPANAVLLPTEFTLTVPASNYLEIKVKPVGADSYEFSKPVSLTMSYSRCTRSNVDKKSLKIFYIDSGTKAILENMGGTDNKTARTVTTDTDHFSGFSVGSN